ncbi:hypothetical protein HMPREF3293_01303 [Christensenella minuta]|uniref:Uncharacterized protein n=1 Tax=Christensenella minuta TaxID=626937 RepID=A0A136Q583_9FIRM|nr:hypothetical protein HMPREF3293_01303 [Christensenella minuta]
MYRGLRLYSAAAAPGLYGLLKSLHTRFMKPGYSKKSTKPYTKLPYVLSQLKDRPPCRPKAAGQFLS